MIWPDMLWFWIIAYDLWNFAYVYNCVGDHSFYAGAALLISCTIPAFFIKKGAWLQHRAPHPRALDDVHDGRAHLRHGLAVRRRLLAQPDARCSSFRPISLAANVAVAVYQVRVIVTRRRNPLKDELFTHLRPYREVLEANAPLVDAPGAAADTAEDVTDEREPVSA